MGTASHKLRPSQFAYEAELLLLCARTHMEPDTAQRVRRLIEARIDWNYLIRQALYHGTIPLLFWNLNRISPEAIPQTILGQLKNAFNAIAGLNLSLTRELIKILNLFGDAGIRALPYKGPVLAAAAYGNLSLRHFSDLDILLAREDILKAKEVLTRQGYRPKLELSANQEIAYLRSHHDYRLVRGQDGVVVEIQWGVTEEMFSFPFDFEAVWERREAAALDITSLSPEDLLLILCVHGTKHRWEQLKWICDVAELVSAYRQRIDWYRLSRQAQDLGGERMLLLGLFLAYKLLSAGIPEHQLRRIDEERELTCLAARIKEKFFGQISDRLRDEPAFFYWKVRERLRDKLAVLLKYFPEYFLRTIVPNSRDHSILRLPAYLSMTYYFLRPIRLICEYSSGFLTRLYR
jgi:hypothetical protein